MKKLMYLTIIVLTILLFYFLENLPFLSILCLLVISFLVFNIITFGKSKSEKIDFLLDNLLKNE